jgi:S1-C subfamily serine protease
MLGRPSAEPQRKPAAKPKRRSVGKPRMGPDPAQITGRGSGFVVSDRGQVLTNHHVVASCGRIRVRSGRRVAPAKLATADARADLALLASSVSVTAKTAPFRRRRAAVLGEQVLIAGYPLQGLLSHEMHVGIGVVSALAGPRGDTRLIQIGTQVQPGNSGGPVLDRSGRVIGLVAGVLPPADAAKAGAIGAPQLSFAIRGELIGSFLERAGVRYRTTASNALDTGVLARRAEAFTVLVECLR